MLRDAVDHLACPVCRGGLALGDDAVRCARGHSFDVARQGYVSLLTGSAAPGTADTAAMVEARARFLGAGHFAAVTAGLRELASAPGGPRVVLDAGAGTGHHLAATLGERDVGIALDVSKHALRRAARAHPRIGAVVADVWRELPVKDAVADVLLNVFAPRNGPEFARVLRPGGVLIVVTPTPRHLSPLVERLGLLSVDEAKARRVEEALGAHFAEAGHQVREAEMRLDHRAVATVAGMGPSAWHTDPAALAEEITRLPDPIAVNLSCRISLFRKIT
ncbi:putative RNA methyltransferase [Sphaerisporangium sp. TRM90804]|uniref:putative RNA methyltransferase n=1 Tax=Sphaerisporangium sp. TRM90804 TaxID=3031113 RepID=UPI0024473DA0|nr:methyltransferase domain-containing protein [Sphaerisporangium sp. TRM90804]MDH2426655.1 methyltransferase domain-containing protein [Sphaerisporangium sp. TRM90804]